MKTDTTTKESLIKTVAWSMAIAFSRGRFTDTPDSEDKDRVIQAEAKANQKKWEATAAMILSIDGHLSQDPFFQLVGIGNTKKWADPHST